MIRYYPGDTIVIDSTELEILTEGFHTISTQKKTKS